MKFLSSLDKKDLSGKTCLLRVDLNVAEGDLHKDDNISIANLPLRFKAILPTIKFLNTKGAKIVLLSHKGRPTKVCKECSLESASKFLSKTLDKKINFINHFNFTEIKSEIKKSQTKSVFLLENLRFLEGEEKNSASLAKDIASLGDVYINDAFGVSHRANASVVAITKFLPSYAGVLLETELKNLNKTKNPKKPFVVILGGAKISDKLELIKRFIKTADYLLVGGGIANTFMASMDLPIGESLYEEKMTGIAKSLFKSDKIMLPADVEIENCKILDIGKKTVEKYAPIIKSAKTIIWNGPLGFIEREKFSKGSLEIAKLAVNSKAEVIIGGGETTTLFAEKFKSKLPSRIFLSTGGGAMLEYLSGKKLPGLTALEKSKK